MLSFKHKERTIRYYRNKFFAHKEVIRKLGANRFDPDNGKFEFAVVNVPTGIDKGDYDTLIALRDKYAANYLQLKTQANFWEILKLFDYLPIEFSKSDMKEILRLHQKYGTFLPELNEYIKAFNQILTEIKPYLKS